MPRTSVASLKLDLNRVVPGVSRGVSSGRTGAFFFALAHRLLNPFDGQLAWFKQAGWPVNPNNIELENVK